jgi:hypothetical protein
MIQHIVQRNAREREDEGEVGFYPSLQAVETLADVLNFHPITSGDLEFGVDDEHGSDRPEVV